MWADEDGEGIGLHSFDEEGAVGDLVELRRVHGTPKSSGQWLVVSDQGETFISNDAFHDHRIRSHALASSRWGAQAAAGEDKFRLRALSFY